MQTKTQTVSLLDIEKQNGYMAQVREYCERLTLVNSARPRVFVLTLGCQQNQSDSEKLLGMAAEMGYEPTETPNDAHLIIVNTCAIREHAEKRALSLIGQYKHIKAKRNELVIAVCGCMPAQEHRRNDIKHRYPYVDLLFGTSVIHRFPEFLCQKIKTQKRVLREDMAERIVAEDIPAERDSNYRAWVSVMYGCNNFCSYCIVPYVRGRERSRRADEIIKEVRELVARGYREITLLGQNVNSYGKDLEDGVNFAGLLRELDKIEGDHWLQFMTSHPKDATKELIDVMAASTHIAHHFHLPMQSGSDKVLRDMNRRYDMDKFMGIVDYIREKMPDATITSDIIVGFPGESDEEFEDTLRALRRAKFDMIFSFIYSPRKGTPAAEMEQLDDKLKSERFDRLLAEQNAVSLESNRALVGKTLRVLCDGASKNDSSVINGRTEGGKIVFFDADESFTGKFVDVEIDRGETFALYGKRK